MKNAINWAILAPGIIANSMALAMKEKSKQNNAICLYAVASRNLEKAKDFAQKWGFKKAYGSYDELLNDKNVDAVYVCNPHAFHFDAVMACLKNGKHVLCEKPAACNIHQLEKMIECAKQNNLFFMEAMWTAFNPTLNEVRKEIDNGIIGEIKNIESHFCNRLKFDANHRLWDTKQAGGALLDLGIYNIYFALFMTHFCKITKQNSIVRMQNKVDAWESVNLCFENGATSTFECACDMPTTSATHDAVIYGTKGFITLKNFFMSQNAEIFVYEKEDGRENKKIKDINIAFDVNGYEYELIEATNCILNEKIESCVHPHKTSLKLCKIMDEIRNDWNLKYPFE